MAMHRDMEHCVATSECGCLMNPERVCRVKENIFKFRVSYKSKSYYSECSDTSLIVSGYETFLENAPVTIKITIQKIVSLSMIEAEMMSAVQ